MFHLVEAHRAYPPETVAVMTVLNEGRLLRCSPKTFGLTPSEAKLACVIARGAPTDLAARELKISKETVRNQLKSVFAKTDTHRRSALVALLASRVTDECMWLPNS
jgi:DNA-binding CsgD family transcriptional regulator